MRDFPVAAVYLAGVLARGVRPGRLCRLWHVVAPNPPSQGDGKQVP